MKRPDNKPRYPTMQLTDAEMLERTHPSLRATFVRLPADPDVPLSAEQLSALFGGDLTALKGAVRLGSQQHNTKREAPLGAQENG